MGAGHHGWVAVDSGRRLKPRVSGCRMHGFLSDEGGLRFTPPEQGDPMMSNRMEAKPRAGEQCRFCGDAKAPCVKTPCCQQWICCDTAFLSFRGGGRCQVAHERLSLCDSHYQDQHGGP